MKQHIYILGKCDYNNSGEKNCKATIEWSLKDGRFSMSANIWNPRETDIYCGGQCVNEVVAYFPDDKKAAQMVAVWEKYHLKSKLPQEVIDEIESWNKPQEPLPDEFQQFLDKHFEMFCTYEGIDDHSMDKYKCRIVNKENPKLHMTSSFRMGSAHRKNMIGKQYNHREATSGMWASNKCQFSPKKSAPGIKSVINSLIQDAQSYKDHGDVADFCEEYGYDNFREGRRVWQACEKIYTDLQKIAANHFWYLVGTEN